MMSSNQRWTTVLGVSTFLVISFLLLLPPPSDAQYCSYRGCCPGRNDQCTTRFYDTLCYCDVFCNTTALDCCPDFWYACFGRPRPTAPPRRARCTYDGTDYYEGTSIKINCNRCVCQRAQDGTTDFACESRPCLVEPETIYEINADSAYLGWRASNYSFLWGLTRPEGVLFRLGTFAPGEVVSRMSPVRNNFDISRLPESFDARSQWPGMIGGVDDQGNCGSSWAVSTASVASDRLAIQYGGVGSPRLSAQHLLSCNIKGQRGCSGGYLDKAWNFVRRYGVVDNYCYPYESGLADDTIMRKLQCKIPYGSSQCPDRRVTSSLYQCTPPYRISSRDVDIMSEIYENGPVQATFLVKNDFFVYRTGVYKHVKLDVTANQANAEQAGWHSVKIVGWGVDRSDPFRPVRYWLCSNSWGRGWGENGMFRIVRGENECEIESFVLGVWMSDN